VGNATADLRALRDRRSPHSRRSTPALPYRLVLAPTHLRVQKAQNYTISCPGLLSEYAVHTNLIQVRSSSNSGTLIIRPVSFSLSSYEHPLSCKRRRGLSCWRHQAG
jgi:hypothetical protein